jgi:hypothetical protein
VRRAGKKPARDCAFYGLDDGNVSAARNLVAARTKGEWIAVLDDYQPWPPTKLERQVVEAERTGADMIACDSIEFRPDDREIIRRPRRLDGWSYAEALSHGYWWAPPSMVMIHKCVFDEIGWRHNIHQMHETLARYRRGHLRAMHSDALHPSARLFLARYTPRSALHAAAGHGLRSFPACRDLRSRWLCRLPALVWAADAMARVSLLAQLAAPAADEVRPALRSYRRYGANGHSDTGLHDAAIMALRSTSSSWEKMAKNLAAHIPTNSSRFLHLTRQDHIERLLETLQAPPAENVNLLVASSSASSHIAGHGPEPD